MMAWWMPQEISGNTNPMDVAERPITIQSGGAAVSLDSSSQYALDDGSQVMIFKYNASSDVGGRTEYTIDFPNNMVADVLVVGGGGGGGSTIQGNIHEGGGGGAGGVVYIKHQPMASGEYTFKVGRGGNANAVGISSQIVANASNAIARIDGIPMEGMGGGYGQHSRNGKGSAGGSGGGSGNADRAYYYSAPSTQGNTVWDDDANAYVPGGHAGQIQIACCRGTGGGGAGGSAIDYNNGGPGIELDITGTPTLYAGGGGAEDDNSVRQNRQGLGGSGIGGQSGFNGSGFAGADHTGSGGGGADNPGTGGKGGSGIIVIRYVVDTDGDGLTEAEEVALGTSATTADHDGTNDAMDMYPLDATKAFDIPDLSDTVDAQIGEASGLDTVEANMVLWLDASNTDYFNNNTISDGDTISQWKDLSGKGNDGYQATSANQPKLMDHGSNPYLEFDGSSDHIALPNIFSGASKATGIIVLKDSRLSTAARNNGHWDFGNYGTVINHYGGGCCRQVYDNFGMSTRPLTVSDIQKNNTTQIYMIQNNGSNFTSYMWMENLASKQVVADSTCDQTQ